MVIFGLLSGILLGEVIARVLYPLPSNLQTSETIRVGMPPTYIQYVDRMPWSHSVIKYKIEGEYATTVSINGKGLRGPEVSFDKPDGEFRILFIGDSYVKAVQVEFEDTVYHQLETLLMDKAKRYKVKVIGAGEAGWGTDRAYQYYRYEGYKYHPDLVIYQFFTNDVADNMRDTFRRFSGMRQHFSIKNGNLIARDVNIITRPSYRYEITLHRHLLLSSRLYALMRDVWHGEEVSFLAQPVYRQVNPTFASISHPLFIYQEPYSDEYKSAWELTEVILSEWNTQVQEDGALLMVVSVPGHWAVYEEDWRDIPQSYPSLALEFSRWNQDKPDDYLNEITHRHDIPYLSLTSTFRTYAANNTQQLYFSQDGHWTEAGHTLAAQTILEWLSEKNLPR